MTKRMLVDATNAEEMRVVVADDERVREFEVETIGKEQLKGNIYVAEVVRVEPSLQAAFVSYGGNRNGFLAFSEIHPEWFSLPKAEKDALMKEVEEAAAKQRNQSLSEDTNGKAEPTSEEDSEKSVEAAAEEKPKKRRGRPSKKDKEAAEKAAKEAEATAKEAAVEEKPKTRRGRPSKKDKEATEEAVKIAREDLTAEEAAEDAKALAIANSIVFDDESAADVAPSKNQKDDKKDKRGGVRRLRRASRGRKKDETEAPTTETSQNESEPKERFVPIHRRFNIGDVLKEKQKIIVQVTKEERGTKGAALTTYISMPGRFTVLMPNTPLAGGISRKISDAEDRKDLRQIYGEITVPNSMGWIIRTAGVGQDKKAIEEDVKNMIKQWKRISKEATAKDIALPKLLHEDGSLIVRAMRDMFTEDVEEVIISGSRVYTTAREYVKSLIPERAKDVKEYKAKSPIFSHYGVEASLNHLHSTRVELESGGYLIINPTEALVSIDVNSGRATQENNIEETAFKTNLEAADEVARQLRLRDLAGLVVIDFIDMEDRRNERAIERAMRKAVHKDRARIQVGGISEFGLLEMSRQRLRPSFNESTTVRCPHCFGAGTLPSIQTAALMVLRNLEQENIHAKADRVIITVATDLAIYMLNYKKDYIRELESHYKFKIIIAADSSYIGPDHHLEMVRVQANGSERSQSKMVVMREKPETMDNRSRRRKRKNTKKEREQTKSTRSAKSDKRSDKDNKNNRGRRGSNKGEEKPVEKSTEKVSTKPEKEAKSEERKPSRGGRRRYSAKNEAKEEAKTQDTVEKPTQKAVEAKTEEKPVQKKAPVKPSLTVQTVGTDGDSQVKKISSKAAKEKKQSWWNRTFS